MNPQTFVFGFRSLARAEAMIKILARFPGSGGLKAFRVEEHIGPAPKRMDGDAPKKPEEHSFQVHHDPKSPVFHNAADLALVVQGYLIGTRATMKKVRQVPHKIVRH